MSLGSRKPPLTHVYQAQIGVCRIMIRLDPESLLEIFSSRSEFSLFHVSTVRLRFE
jgi:hypothetical protein